MNNQTNTLNQAALLAMIEELKQSNAALQMSLAKKATTSGGIKVSEKGGASVYGIGRFPVTLYKSQWIKLLAKSEEIKQFLIDNNDLLKVKE